MEVLAATEDFEKERGRCDDSVCCTYRQLQQPLSIALMRNCKPLIMQWALLPAGLHLSRVHCKNGKRTQRLELSTRKTCGICPPLLPTNSRPNSIVVRKGNPSLERGEGGKQGSNKQGMGDWTVVRHKRGAAGRKTSGPNVAQRVVLPSGKKSSSPAGHVGFYSPRQPPESHTYFASVPEAASELQCPNDKEGEEERLLGKMRRAIAKVEQSMFFSRFMKQMKDLEVVENLSRSGTGNAFRVGEGGEEEGEEGGEEGDEEEEEEDPHERSKEGGEEKSLSRKVELVVYGVGSITNSEISRCQLSLAVLLKQKSADIGSVFVYDPVMSISDRSVMLQLDVSPLEDNDEGRRPLNGPTLFYMPHCDVELYESVLQANLKPGVVDQMVILGNSFRTYQHRWSVSPLPQGERPRCLLNVQPTVEEIQLADNFSPTAFNDTSWHFFSKVEVSKLH